MNAIVAFAIMLLTILATLLGMAGIVAWWKQTRGAWAGNNYGRFVMTFLISGVLLAGGTVVGRFVGRWPGDLYLILAAWIGLCVALSMPIFLWWNSRKDAKDGTDARR